MARRQNVDTHTHTHIDILVHMPATHSMAAIATVPIYLGEIGCVVKGLPSHLGVASRVMTTWESHGGMNIWPL